MIDRILVKAYHFLQNAQKREMIKRLNNNPNARIGTNVQFGTTFSVSNSKAKVSIGDNSWIYASINIFPHNNDCELSIGKDCYIGDNSRLWVAKKMVVGDRTLIAHNVNIFDTTTHPIDKSIRFAHECVVKTKGMPTESYETIEESPVIIGDDVWVGCNCTILKGVKIGNGSIIGAGSVVTKDVPAGVMAAGNPARVIKNLT